MIRFDFSSLEFLICLKFRYEDFEFIGLMPEIHIPI